MTGLRRSALLAELILAALGAFPLMAQVDCDTLLVDNAHLIGPTGTKNITDAANTLMAAGADVRVRTETGLQGYSTPDYLEKAFERACPSWTSPNGTRKNNLVVVMFVKPDWSAIYPGKEFDGAMTSQQTAIANLMSAKVRDANYAGALVAGLKGVKSALDGKTVSGSPSASTTTKQTAPQVINETKIINEQPADYSFLKWLLILGALGAIGWFAFKFFTGKKAETETRQGAQQDAQLARSEVAELINKMTSDFASYEVLTRPTDPDRVNRVNDLISAASESFATLSKSSLCDPDQNGLTESQYQNMVTRYNSIKTDLRGAQSLMNGVTHTVQPERVTPIAHREDPPPPARASEPEAPASIPHPSAPVYTMTSGYEGRTRHLHHDPVVIHDTTVIREDSGPAIIPVFIPQTETRYEERGRDLGYPVINDNPLGYRTGNDEPSGISVRAGNDDREDSGISVRAGSSEPSSGTTY